MEILINISLGISKEVVDECYDFAEKQYITSFEKYKEREQYDKDKIILDIANGKIGEFGAYEYLCNKGYQCSKPDLNIYKSNEKKFDADLNCAGVGVCVKSQSKEQADRFGLSWTIQRGGNGGNNTDKILKRGCDDYLFIGTMIIYNDDSVYVDIKTIIRVGDLFKFQLLEEPKSPKLIGIKYAVYYDTISRKVPNYFIVK